MKIHYFQRYHEKENVATANTMLLLSRLYTYSPHKFFAFLKMQLAENDFEPELSFHIQEKSQNSVPDAMITQESFKVVVETKMSDWFYTDQLMRHLNAFDEEKQKVLITLAPQHMNEEKKNAFEKELKQYNQEKSAFPVRHVNTTFAELADAVRDVLDERDYEMQEVLADYLDYCREDGLIPDGWNYMRVQLAGATFDFNVQHGVYYDNSDRGFRANEILGLYTNKSVRAIGKIVSMITAVETEHGVEYRTELGDLTEERKRIITEAMTDGDSHGYDLRKTEHRYFFVDRFYDTDFRKSTPRAPMGSRVFDLSQVLETEKIPDMEELAASLRDKVWT